MLTAFRLFILSLDIPFDTHLMAALSETPGKSLSHPAFPMSR